MKKLLFVFILLPIISFNQPINKLNMENETSHLTELMGAYIKECYNDSTYVEYWKHHSPPTSTDSNGITIEDAIYIEPTLIKEYQHREPTFVGFYEWLKKQQLTKEESIFIKAGEKELKQITKQNKH